MQKDYAKYLFAVLLFGTNGIVASQIGMSSYHIVLMRTMTGGLLLLLIFLISKHRFRFYKHPKDMAFSLASGIATGISWMFLYEAYSQIGVGISTLLCYCGPVIVMLLSPLIFKERLTAVKLICFIAVAVGVVLINGQSAEKLNARGIICGLLSALTYAVMIIANKKSEHIHGLEKPVIALLAAFITVAVFVGIKEGGYALRLTHEDIIWIAVLGVINTGLGFYLYFSSIGELPVQSVAICGYLEPLSAVLFSVLLLHEAMTGPQIIGAALIIGGALIGECFKRPERCS
ncbi:MAG: EamA family transporter [Oscillospiraceae bacterium]|nr:EamA family transporter [Oscillospiraceae bacterium]